MRIISFGELPRVALAYRAQFALSKIVPSVMSIWQAIRSAHVAQYISAAYRGVAIIEGFCSGGCQDYIQKKPSHRMRLQDRADPSAYAH